MAALRNRELHTSEAPLASVNAEFGLPRFTRVAEVICSHLQLDPMDVVGTSIIVHGRALVDAEDKKLAHEVSTKIDAAKAFFEKLTDTEIADRRARAVGFTIPMIRCLPVSLWFLLNSKQFVRRTSDCRTT